MQQACKKMKMVISNRKAVQSTKVSFQEKKNKKKKKKKNEFLTWKEKLVKCLTWPGQAPHKVITIMAVTKIGVLVTAVRIGIYHMTEGIDHIIGKIDTIHHHQGHPQIILGTGIKIPFMSMTNLVVDVIRQGLRLIVVEVHLEKGPAYQEERILTEDTRPQEDTQHPR